MTSKENKGVFAYSYSFQEMFLSKDIFLVPYYIAKEIKGELEYCYQVNMGNTDIPNDHRGAIVRRSKIKNEFLTLLWNVVFKAWTLDVLFLNGSSAKHMLVVWLYKVLRPKGRVVIFGDMEATLAKEFAETGLVYSIGVSAWIKKRLTNFFFDHVTYIVANTEAYQIMKGLCEKQGWKGLLHFYPCLDDELFREYDLQRIPLQEKENVMVCVGRIGNYQKNTEMLLDALEQVDLKEWKIYMIGPVTSSFDLTKKGNFQEKIDDFLARNPRHKDKIIFTGMVYDMKEIFSYYNRARVLLSTARHEGFANVYSQAAALGCFVVSTDVGGADIGSNQWRFGIKIEQEDCKGLADVLNGIVKGSIRIDKQMTVPFEDMCYSIRVNRVLLPFMEEV